MQIQFVPKRKWSSAPKNCTTTTNTVTASAFKGNFVRRDSLYTWFPPFTIECAQEDTIPELQTFEKLKRVKTVAACSQACNKDPACDFYKWRVREASEQKLRDYVGILPHIGALKLSCNQPLNHHIMASKNN